MRITRQAKEETRARIVAAARELFGRGGFERTSTRDLAAAAGIATGTLFNYFPTKEALAISILGDALEAGRVGYESRRHGGEDLQEDLFAHVAAGLRELEPYRSFVGEVIESAMSPFASATDEGGRVRARHLETVHTLIRGHGHDEPGFVAMHLYWTLYLGVLAFWSNDESPHQEDALVVLDQSLRMFVNSIHTGSKGKEDSDGS